MQCPPKQVPLGPGKCVASDICDVAYNDRLDLMEAVRLGVANKNFRPEGGGLAKRLTQYAANLASWCFAAAENRAMEVASYVTESGVETRITKREFDFPDAPDFKDLGLPGLLIGLYIAVFLLLTRHLRLRFIKRNQPNCPSARLSYLFLGLDLVLLMGAGTSGWFLGTSRKGTASETISMVFYVASYVLYLLSRALAVLTGHATDEPLSLPPEGRLSESQLDEAKNIIALSNELLQLHAEGERHPSQRSEEALEDLRSIKWLRELTDVLIKSSAEV